MNFEVAIPSYQRAEKLKASTLRNIIAHSFDLNRVAIFVNNEQEKADYERDISGVKIVACNTKTLCETKTFVNQYYPEGTHIVSLDDDIQEFRFLNNDKTLIATLNRMFELLHEEKATLFGVYPCYTSNNFYMKERVAVGFQFIIGMLYGFINKRTIYPEVNPEDKWLSCELYKQDGKTLRYEGLVIKSRHFAPGGLTEYRNKNDMIEKHRQFEKLFPDLLVYVMKKNGVPDCNLKRMKREFRPLFQESDTQPVQTSASG